MLAIFPCNPMPAESKNETVTIEAGTKVPVPKRGIVGTVVPLRYSVQFDRHGDDSNSSLLDAYRHQIANNDGVIHQFGTQGPNAGASNPGAALRSMATVYIDGEEKDPTDGTKSRAEAIAGARAVEQQSLSAVLEITALTRDQLQNMAHPPEGIRIVADLDPRDATFIECPQHCPEISELEEGGRCTLASDFGLFTLPDGRTFSFKKGFPMIVVEQDDCIVVRAEQLRGSYLQIHTSDRDQAVMVFLEHLATDCGRILSNTYGNDQNAKLDIPWLQHYCELKKKSMDDPPMMPADAIKSFLRITEPSK